jgi:hypothetical protein
MDLSAYTAWERDGSNLIGWKRAASGDGSVLGDRMLILRPGDDGYDAAAQIVSADEARQTAAPTDPGAAARFREALRREPEPR